MLVLYANDILFANPSVLDFEKLLLLICKHNGYIINMYYGCSRTSLTRGGR